MKRLLIITTTIFALAIAVAGCGGDDNKDAAPAGDETAQATGATGAGDGSGCANVEQPPPKDGSLKKPGKKLDTKKRYLAVVETTCGKFTIQLDVKRAPKTGASFKHMADAGLFDETFFHRIVADFVIQGGDPQGSGSGGPGYKVEEEPPSDLQYEVGSVAMAKAGNEAPGTSGSQFFVVTGAQGQTLPPEYALLGKVTDGMDVVDTIAGFSTPQQSPAKIVVVKSIKVTAR